MAFELDQWLADSVCRVELALTHYEGTQPVGRTTLALADVKDAPRDVEFNGAVWRCEVYIKPVPDRQDASDLIAHFSIIAGHARECSVGVRLVFDEWCPQNYVLIPGAVYDGNRFESRLLSYGSRLADPADLGPDTPIIVRDVPRLNFHSGPSRLQLLTGDGATPAVGCYRPQEKTGIWLLTPQGTEVGDSGLTVEETSDRGQAVVSVTAPGVREGTKYAMCTTQVPSDDHAADLAEGEAITLQLRLYFFTCPHVQYLFDRFAVIRKDLTGPVRLFHGLPFSAAWKLLEDKYNRDNWWEEPGFYTQVSGQRRLFGTGWGQGGIVVQYPLLMEGNETSKQRALRTLDFFLTHCVSPAGFFYDFHDGVKPLDTRREEVTDNSWHLVRRDFEALYALIKQFRLLEKQTPDFNIPPLWLEAIRRCADAWSRQWERYGQLGQVVNLLTGEIIIGGGANGALAPAALSMVAQYLGEESYLQCAKEIALSFYDRYVTQGIIYGGTEDALQSPDSESSFALLESFVTLYDQGGGNCPAVPHLVRFLRFCLSA